MARYVRHFRLFGSNLRSSDGGFCQVNLSCRGVHTQVVTRSLVIRLFSRNFAGCRSWPAAHRSTCVSHQICSHGNNPWVTACGVSGLRWNSTGSAPAGGDTAASVTSSLPEGYIPEPPPIPELLPPEGATEIIQELTALGEPTLQSLGLANWTPSGVVQWGLESLHAGIDIPWWTAIVTGTVCLRLLVFPLVVFAQRNAANMHNNMPTMQRLQEKFTRARQSGNPLEAARAGNDLMEFMKTNKVNPMKNMLVPMCQLPIFLSVFVGIRQMANLPVESLTTGGLFWFTDLTIPDPYFALPLMTAATFLATVELGVDGVSADTMGTTMRYVFRAMPVIMVPFIINFPSAMLCYWFTSNCFSLVQVLFLRIPRVRLYFGIPEKIVHPKVDKKDKKGFREGFRESMKNASLAAQMAERDRVDSVKFKEAGMGPIQKTYSYDPTKVKGQKAISAKSKS